MRSVCCAAYIEQLFRLAVVPLSEQRVTAAVFYINVQFARICGKFRFHFQFVSQKFVFYDDLAVIIGCARFLSRILMRLAVRILAFYFFISVEHINVYIEFSYHSAVYVLYRHSRFNRGVGRQTAAEYEISAVVV